MNTSNVRAPESEIADFTDSLQLRLISIPSRNKVAKKS